MLTERFLFMLLALTEKEREVVVDHYVRGQSISELAEEWGVTRSVVHQLKERADGKMREAYIAWTERQEALVAV